MNDITSFTNGDLVIIDTQTERAKNILSIQVGSLEYAPNVGVDLAYFLSENYRFQNESFRAYLVEVLAANSVNVAEVTKSVEDLTTKLTFELNAEDSSDSLIAR